MFSWMWSVARDMQWWSDVLPSVVFIISKIEDVFELQ